MHSDSTSATERRRLQSLVRQPSPTFGERKSEWRARILAPSTLAADHGHEGRADVFSLQSQHFGEAK